MPAGQHKADKKKGILSDTSITLGGFYSFRTFQSELRLIKYRDKETGKILMFLTNNFRLSAATIAAIYKARWQIELFFKWIKQNLKIKTFLGTSENAVLTQIWVAMIYYLMLAFIKFQTKYSFSLLELTRTVKDLLMEPVSLIEILRLKYDKFYKPFKPPDFQLAFL
jgi:IS4 transposase